MWNQEPMPQTDVLMAKEEGLGVVLCSRKQVTGHSKMVTKKMRNAWGPHGKICNLVRL